MTTRRTDPDREAPFPAPIAPGNRASLANAREAMIRDLVMEAVRTALQDGAAQAENPGEYLTDAVREVTLAMEMIGPSSDSEGNSLRTMLAEVMVEAAEEIARSNRT